MNHNLLNFWSMYVRYLFCNPVLVPRFSILEDTNISHIYCSDSEVVDSRDTLYNMSPDIAVSFNTINHDTVPKLKSVHKI